MPTALIFGASRGLGRALAEEHLKRGWEVIATVRDAAALSDLRSDALTTETIDTTDWAGIDALRGRLAGRPLDDSQTAEAPCSSARAIERYSTFAPRASTSAKNAPCVVPLSTPSSTGVVT